jgi:alpha-L-fucosidase
VRNAPGLPIVEDHFTATWTGYIAAEHTGEHTFSAVVDDGMRLYVAGRLVLDLRDPAAADTDAGAGREDDPRPLPGRIVLERGVKVPIRIEYHETVQNARIHLYWESPAFARQIVPQANLFSTATVPTGDGLQAVYRSQRQHVAYTHNHGNLYAVAFAWPEDEFVLPVAAPAPGTRISLLGRPGALPWRHIDGRLIIDTSPVRYSEMPGHHAWTFRIENHE